MFGSFKKKGRILCIFIAKNYLCPETGTEELIDQLEVEDVKRTARHGGGTNSTRFNSASSTRTLA